MVRRCSGDLREKILIRLRGVECRAGEAGDHVLGEPWVGRYPTGARLDLPGDGEKLLQGL